jgi:hypothetical protein
MQSYQKVLRSGIKLSKTAPQFSRVASCTLAATQGNAIMTSQFVGF